MDTVFVYLIGVLLVSGVAGFLATDAYRDEVFVIGMFVLFWPLAFGVAMLGGLFVALPMWVGRKLRG